MTDPRILVTGAGGFVCSQIAVALHRAGHDVLATDRMFDADTIARLEGVGVLGGPLHDVFASGHVGPLTAVVHGAAITASPARLGISNAEHIRCNMDLLTHAMAAGRAAGAAKFLFLSSMGVFEPHDSPAPGGQFTEATRPTASCTYCAAKSAGETLMASAAEPGFATQSLRLGNIFGPYEAVRESRQHLCLVSRMIVEARSTGVITVRTPDALREWSWLPDLADAVVGVLASMPGGAEMQHAGTPPVMSDLALARSIAERIPGTEVRPSPPPHDPIRPPMASGVPSVFDRVNWTGIEAALDMLVHPELAP